MKKKLKKSSKKTEVREVVIEVGSPESEDAFVVKKTAGVRVTVINYNKCFLPLDADPQDDPEPDYTLLDEDFVIGD